MEHKYWRTKFKSQACALNWLGHSFYKFNDFENDEIIYSFVNSEVLQQKIKLLDKIKYDFSNIGVDI